jgi:YHS domain-containing protein
MSDLNQLAQRIKEKLAGADQRKQIEQNHLQLRMSEYEQRHERYTGIADKLVQDVIRPRLKKLAEHFDNAEFPEHDPPARHSVVCCFQHTPRFPATAKLELSVSRDGQCETLLVRYDLEILPVFFQFEGHDQLSVPLNRVVDAQVAAWVEEKVLQFVDTYLRLEAVDQYQTENLVIDPVCGMRINKTYAAAEMTYQGQTYYFCIPDCKDRFAADPSAYLGAARPAP